MQQLLLITICTLLMATQACVKNKGCTDLLALNYSPNATGEGDDKKCDYKAVTFYSLSKQYVVAPADTVDIDKITVYLNKENVSHVTDEVAVIKTTLNNTPACYIPADGVVTFEDTKRRNYTWNISLSLANGNTVHNYRYGHFEPGKNCQTIQVYP